AILSSGSGFGNYNSPWVDTTNAARAERDTLVQHLAVQVPLPAVAPFTVSVCRANAALPRTCVQTGLQCMVDIGQQTCVDDTNTMTLLTGALYTVEIVTPGSPGGPPAYAFELIDIPP